MTSEKPGEGATRAVAAAADPSPFDEPDGWDYPDDNDAAEATDAAISAPAVRRESLQDRENFKSSGTFVLHPGKKVRVTGRTFLFEGKTHGPRVKLQILKEKKTGFFLPEWEPADGRIALDGPEVEELYARLTEARQNLGADGEGDYLVVRTGTKPDLTGLEALMRMVADDPASFVPLTEMVGPEQIDALRAVVNIGRFKKAKEELGRLIAENPPETTFQHWFEENDWVFGTEYVEILRKPRHIAPDSVIDLIFLAVDDFADIFELKRPGADVFVPIRPGGYLIPSGDLNEAFGQAVRYLSEADNMGFFNEVTRDVPFYRPRVRLVIGRSTGWTPAHRRVYRETMAAWNRVELLTYDMVLRRIDLLIRTMTRELKAKAVEDFANR